MSPFALPVRRPVATAMFFLAVVILGLIGWRRLPVELLPDLSGNDLSIQFARAGGDPEVLERQILMPLESRISGLPDVLEMVGEVRGSTGSLQISFAPQTDIDVRELELEQIASEIRRTQPAGTFVAVQSMDTSFLTRFVMILQVTGGADRNSLFDLVEQRVSPRLASVSGVSQVMPTGGSGREVTVWVDPDRCAAAGVTTGQVTAALGAAVSRLRFLGGVEDEAGRTAVVLDGRPRGVVSLGEVLVDPQRAVRVRHVARVEQGSGREEQVFRVDGEPTVGLVVFQEEGANVVEVGTRLRQRLEELREELRPYGLGLLVSFDGAEEVEEQLGRLQRLAFTGFLIALVVLYLFLRQWRAVAVVAVAVPVSLLAALGMLYLAGQVLNLLTLFGLAIGIGLLVDNSVVVYEAVQRRLERGLSPDEAAVAGVQSTARALIAASATTAIVFLIGFILDFESALVRTLLRILALAILMPLASSLVVAVGLVPLLARHLAAPAAMARLREDRRRRRRFGGLIPPDRGRALFAGVVKVALRRPSGWLVGIGVALLLTVLFALPLTLVRGGAQEASQADQVQLAVRFSDGRSLDGATVTFESLEAAARNIEGVDRVESVIREENGSITVHFVDPDERPGDFSVGKVREAIRDAARVQSGVEILEQGAGNGGGLDQLFGQAAAEVVVSGPESRTLQDLAGEVQRRLDALPEVASAWVEIQRGQDELRVIPDRAVLAGFGLTPDQVLPVIRGLGREGVEMETGFTLANGRELPLRVRREGESGDSLRGLDRLRLATPNGVLPIRAVARLERAPAPPSIGHRDGRRELRVLYNLTADAPSSGSRRQALNDQIRQAARDVYRPRGYTVETGEDDSGTSWFRRALLPILALLFLVLAVTFESLTLPILIFLALPLTLLGATWALVFTGQSLLDPMALVGVVALIGLTVNPAILLVDRMQQRIRSQLAGGEGAWSPGAAALAAVRERTRPVLLTTATTVAGLWPLALATGRENEIWPPFAITVIGGLLTSTLLTLLAIPVGFLFLAYLDRLFGRLGPWVMIGWAAATVSVMAPLILSGQITSLLWQILTTLLVGALFLGAASWWVPKADPRKMLASDGPAPVLEVRALSKTYGLPGPVGKAWQAPRDFARRVLEVGGTVFEPRDARLKLLPLALLCAAMIYLSGSVGSLFWSFVFLALATVFAVRWALEWRRFRGGVDELGQVRPGGLGGWLAVLLPWIALGWFAWRHALAPRLAEETARMGPTSLLFLTGLLIFVQLGRRTARRLSSGELGELVTEGRLQRPRGAWRWLSRRVFGLDLPREPVRALASTRFRIEGGMVGILGPNGAGKTTLLRMLSGILDPSTGRITLGGIHLEKLRRYLGRWVGYLPQDAGLAPDLTAREYLTYYALLYDLGDPEERRQRVDSLLAEVGLGERADEKIGGFSGGMRQRVAVARTLLRLPPVIIVDEPTVGLDPRERIRFRNLLSRLSKGRVVLFSTHVVEDVAVACERVIVLAGGRLRFDGPPEELALAARGEIWELTLPESELSSVSPEAKLVDQVPAGDGMARLRLLSPRRPHPEAREAEATLEEGYLHLVRLAEASP